MDMDFHYYGTYLAARIAGFNVEDATTIAHAAQYVDDSTNYSNRLRLALLDREKKTMNPIPTCMDPIGELKWNYPKTGELTGTMVRQVWVPFHFLPGNYKSKNYKDDNWNHRIGQCLQISTVSKDYLWAFNLICLPRSPLAAEMINQNWGNKVSGDLPSNWLHKLGIMMHVYADTYAHMYFAGTPESHINDVYDVRDAVAVVADDGRYTLEPIQYIYGQPIKWCQAGGWLAYELDKEPQVPKGPTDTSSSYIGHGRAGHLPDQPWRSFAFTPPWAKNPLGDGSLQRSNPYLYKQAFLEMILVLRHQRLIANTLIAKTVIEYGENDFTIGSALDELVLRQVGLNNYREIIKVLKTQDFSNRDYNNTINYRAINWRNLIGLLYRETPPAPYDPEAWVAAAEKEVIGTDKYYMTDYYKFNCATIDHANFVRDHLRKDNMLADWAPVPTPHLPH